MPPEPIIVTGLTNEEFLKRYAKAGCVGLSGGDTPVDLAIRHAQRHLDGEKHWGVWSHAFLFQGVRADGHHWVIESDLQFHRKHIQLGAQENRVAKYHDDKFYATMAVMDFGLDEKQVAALISAGLELVASHERYSMRELFGTVLAMRKPELRARENRLARDHSVFCSALVRQLFNSIGLDLAPGIHDKHTAPEDVARTSLPHTIYILRRETTFTRLAALRTRLHERVQSKLQKIKKRSKIASA